VCGPTLTPVPSDIVALGLRKTWPMIRSAVEAIRASAHFKYDPQATYHHPHSATTIGHGQPVYCGYHTQTNSVGRAWQSVPAAISFIRSLNMNWPGLRHRRLWNELGERDQR